MMPRLLRAFMQWVWSGCSFMPVEFSVWPDCENGKSSDDWPVIYKHQAK